MGKAIDYATPAGWAGGIYSEATGHGWTGNNPVGNAVNGAVGAVTPASTAGVQQAAKDAQNIQNQFLANYTALQPGQAPTMNAATANAAGPVGAAQASAAPGINAAQMQAAQINGANLAQDRNAQLALAGSLQGTINGTAGPSVAQLQQQQAFGQLAAQQAGLAAAAGRGGNQALAARTAMQQQGQLGAQAASQAALLRANEVATAQGQIGNVITNAQGADLSQAGTNAQLQQAAGSQNATLAQQAALANQGNVQAANLANAGMAQQAIAQTSAQQQQANLANASNVQAANAANQASQLTQQQQFITQQANLGGLTNTANANQVNAQVGALNAQTAQKAQTANMISQGLGAVGTLSDERLKEDIKPLGHDHIAAFLESFKPKQFRYAAGAPVPDPGKAHGGAMAQDIEKSPLGRTLVKPGPGGAKVVDTGHATMANMAALADMHQRLSRVEKAVSSGSRRRAA